MVKSDEKENCRVFGHLQLFGPTVSKLRGVDALPNRLACLAGFGRGQITAVIGQVIVHAREEE